MGVSRKATQGRKTMKGYKLTLAIAVALLAMASTSFANGKLALTPQQATMLLNGPPIQKLELDAFCSQSPCNLKWYVLLSNSNVGSIDNNSGPVTHFIAGTEPGQAIIVVQDGQGNMQFAVITVLK
jgi:hypothetical protein